MAIFSVDSDAVLTASTAVRNTIDRVRAEHNTMNANLNQLQSVWTGGASVAFSGTITDWRAAQARIEEALTAISLAMDTAGRQYQDAELANTSLFR